MTSNAARAQDLLTKSSYCRNSKHARCKTAGCECKCHSEVEQLDHSAAEKAAAAVEAEGTAPEPTAEQIIADRLDPSKAPAPAPKPAKKAKAPKTEKPVVKGTVDGKLSNAHKRAIRVQMVAYLGAMPVELTGDLEGVTPAEAAAYVDTYWVKYIDPARDKARHSK
jgi:hypothetical protein